MQSYILQCNEIFWITVCICLLAEYQCQVLVVIGLTTSTSPSSFIASLQSHRSSSNCWPVTRFNIKLVIHFLVSWPPSTMTALSTLVRIHCCRKIILFISSLKWRVMPSVHFCLSLQSILIVNEAFVFFSFGCTLSILQHLYWIRDVRINTFSYSSVTHWLPIHFTTNWECDLENLMLFGALMSTLDCGKLHRKIASRALEIPKLVCKSLPLLYLCLCFWI